MDQETSISAQHTGAAGELRICADLLLRGYEVYRNVSSAGVDVVAYKNGKFYRVEVKANTVGKGCKKNANWDVRATANDRYGRIRYFLAAEGREFKFETLPCSGIQKADTPDFEVSNG
jgi:hypothetical protein